MKEIDELTERIDGQDEIIDSLIKKITDQEKREPKTADYTLHFEALQKIFEVFLVRYNKENAELKQAVTLLNISYPAEQIQTTLIEVKTILEAIRKSLPVKVKHEFDPKTKGWIIAGVVLLIVTAISSGLCGHLWSENMRLQANDIKFRMLRQCYPIQANWAEQHYYNNPDAAEGETIRLENEAKERSAAADIVNQKQRRIKVAYKTLIKLKHH
ncbi:hypothetical protein DIU31_030615 [Mucilaginibacter rubeus]|uniref:Uncharacterized protein n=1 Tax=Mucilaginibacter rubeus TaxID=2027860 RepID=A0AAE6MLC8_9SPHI|nr:MULTISPECIES: hypothetical protein [Mucilaginibacter]QEM07641.1 hypothetical protein DIU31_030615 [Mucilaginibacter rubeus]QEM20095.1 hypothetical protein DIU38_030215 [Mucilaginibacter gossypii]QTE43193.1 hypothetical protein J3L19_30445 [Mucilaginibacter rubeus]QTE49793.1 hypothetical protein J3L21_30400 [Mucilaginibacter rubeus]QTE54886.1 hypothetical protein J3L23_22020 [Mucilaginibacter rubeus]